MVLWPTQRLRWTREGLVYIVRLARRCWSTGLLPADQPDPAGRRAGGRPDRRLDRRQRGDAAAAAGRRAGCPPTSSPATRCTSTTRWRTTADGRPRWPCSSRTSWSRSTGRSPGSTGLTPRVFFPRVPGRSGRGSAGRDRARSGASIGSATLDLVTRSPFGLLERRVTIAEPDELIVYPTVGQLTRRWHLVQRQASETRRGPAARPLGAAAGVPRPARLPARRQPALDPLADLGPARPADGQGVRAAERAGPGRPDRPVAAADARSRPSSARRSSRRSGSPRRSAWRPAGTWAAGCSWAGPGRRPGVRQGPASVKLLHELLEQLAVMRPATEGSLAALLDALPPVDPPRGDPDRRLDPAGQPARGGRAVGAALGGLGAAGCSAGSILLDASRGDLADLIQSRRQLGVDRAAAGASRASDDVRSHGRAGRRPAGPGRAGLAEAEHRSRGRNGTGGRR